VAGAAPLLLPVVASAPSAGGAPLGQVLVVGGFTAAAYALLAWVILRERSGRPTWIGRAADLAAHIDGGPRWFVLPTLISLGGALSGAVGVYWDVSYHISLGRDPGPLANPSHYFIFLGLLAIFFGGALGMALATEDLPRRTLRITRTWRSPYGMAAVTGIALCALAGFPLDDVWHRIFGQDVTEWGPTHVLMIGGTILLPYGLLLAAAEARQTSRSPAVSHVSFVSTSYLIIGPVAFLLEFAFGVPQFPLVTDPIVISLAASAGLVLASLRGVRHVGGVWAFYVLVQMGLMAINHFVWQALTPRLPLMAGGLVVAVVLTRFARPTAAYGAVAGALVALGTVAVEYPWSHVFMPIPWPASIVPEALLFGGLTGAGIGLVVVWLDSRLHEVRPHAANSTRPSVRGVFALAGLALVLAVFAWNVPPRTDVNGVAGVTVEKISRGRAYVDVQVEPSLVAGAAWFRVLSWQGGGLVRSDLREVGTGRYRTDQPIPVSGSWKSLVRLHQPLHDLVAVPIFLPADAAIPAPAYSPHDGPRQFVSERSILQREQKKDVPLWLWTFGYLSVAVVFAVLFWVVAAAYTRAGRPSEPTPRRSRDLAGAH